MLTRISLINSKGYGKAEMKLDNCDSMQLVGPNNIGKSTLIYALNFLFVVDGQKMSFSGQRKGDKETIHHYFPTHNKSFLIFEINKLGYYCILVKRNTDGELEYYKIDSEYDEEYFFENEGAHQRLLNFDEVIGKLLERGVVHSKFATKSDVFNLVYHRGTKNNAVVWLEDTVKADGLSNNFSKVYRYLINSKLITNKTLKESLIIADNRENEGLNFSQKNKKDITDLLRINEEIKSIKSVRTDFLEFRESVKVYNSKTRIVSELISAFNSSYTAAIPELEISSIERGRHIAAVHNEINEILKPKELNYASYIGEKNADVKNKTNLLAEKPAALNEIHKYERVDFLKESLRNLDKDRKDIETRFTTIEIQKLSSKQLEMRIDKLNYQIASLENQIDNYNNLLIHKISDNEEVKQLLNSVLSEQVTSLPSKQIKKPIKKISAKLLAIFDGEIDITKGITLKEFKSVKELKDELKGLQIEKKQTEELLKTVVDKEKIDSKLKVILNEIELIKEKVKLIESKPALEKQIRSITDDIKTLSLEKKELEEFLSSLVKEISQKQIMFDKLQEEKRGLEGRVRELKERKIEVEAINLAPTDYETNDNLDYIFSKIQIHQKDRIELKVKKDATFDNLKYRLRNNSADIEQFISFVEDEIACLADKERSIDGLLSSISTQFANPAYTLLKRYEEFKQFVYTKFNEKLSQTRISNIESMKIDLLDNERIIGELKKIASIQEFNGQMSFEFDQSENLKVLNAYLDSGKRVSFDELFNIELLLHIKGTDKRVDLANQVESDGTDRMIRLVMIMSIINRLAVTDEQNKIALFIDEVATIDKQNRPEIVKFCKEHNFLPIFAAPDAVEGFNKYYFIYPSKGKINISEKQNAVIVERNGTVQPITKITKSK
ncbi:MAG: hypothetical protein Q8L90_05670 [Bacteroidota bacterium]|nr:hypothetical protein [Bacteroidota bacterium]